MCDLWLLTFGVLSKVAALLQSRISKVDHAAMRKMAEERALTAQRAASEKARKEKEVRTLWVVVGTSLE